MRILILATALSAIAAVNPEPFAAGIAGLRGIFAGKSGVWIADAGYGAELGDTTFCGTTPEAGPSCEGASSVVSVKAYDAIPPTQPFITGLRSVAGQDSGVGPSGVTDVIVAEDGVFVLIGKAAISTPPSWGCKLYRYANSLDNDERELIADFEAYEWAHNPDGTQLDCNSFRMARDKDGSFVVADSGANVIWRVRNGNVSVAGVWSQIDLEGGGKTDAVPTGIDIAPDGSIVVGNLVGFPFPAGAASVRRYRPDGKFDVIADGFTHIQDVGYDADGNLYVVELSPSLLYYFGPPNPENPPPFGSLYRVTGAGKGARKELIYSGPALVFASGLTFGPEGEIYVGSGALGGRVGCPSACATTGTISRFWVNGEDGKGKAGKAAPEPKGKGKAGKAELEYNTVVTGISSPRGLFIGKTGLWIAEAGVGKGNGAADGACTTSQGQPNCQGPTAGVSLRAWDAIIPTMQVFDGFPSVSLPNAVRPYGLTDVHFDWDGTFILVGQAPQRPNTWGCKLLWFKPGNTWEEIEASKVVLADLEAYENAHNPDTHNFECNSFRLDRDADGSFLVADSAANTIYRVTLEGEISVETVWAGTPSAGAHYGVIDAVPTGIAIDSDGSFIVGNLVGVPFPKGWAEVRRYWKENGTYTYETIADGFTHIQDVAIDAEGHYWVVELSQNSLASINATNPPWGAVSRINRWTWEVEKFLSEGELNYAMGLAIGPDGTVYVGNNGNGGALYNGQILSFVPPAAGPKPPAGEPKDGKAGKPGAKEGAAKEKKAAAKDIGLGLGIGVPVAAVVAVAGVVTARKLARRKTRTPKPDNAQMAVVVV